MLYQKIANLVSQELQDVEKELIGYLSGSNPLISKASEHICKSGGKRIRPLLVLLCAKLCGYSGSDAIVCASASEMMHTATLLHDDVIDEATTRRGSASVNSVLGNSVPILVGDYLFSLSSVLLADHHLYEILGMLSNTIKTVVDGELLEIVQRKDFDTTEEHYYAIVTKKTASLFAFCCQIGAILGKNGNSHQAALANFGLKLGIAFQVIDDLLDFTAQEKKLGKPVGNDIKEGNLTLLLIHLLQQATTSEQARVKEIIQNADSDYSQADYINELIEKYNIGANISKIAKDYIQDAQKSLSIFDKSDYLDALLTISDYVVYRSV